MFFISWIIYFKSSTSDRKAVCWRLKARICIRLVVTGCVRGGVTMSFDGHKSEHLKNRLLATVDDTELEPLVFAVLDI